jgi:hypothetical protein
MEKKEVIKHSSAIQISNKVNLLQRKAWNVLLANAFDNLEDQEEHKIKLKDLCFVLKYDRRNDFYLKQLLKDLVSINVEWNVLGKDGEEWGIAALLAEAEIINGVCYYSYGARFRKRLHNPNMYAKISLNLQNRFNSKYSLALYELFIDYFNTKAKYGETPWITIEKFRKLLGLNENEYKQFKILNRDIIKKAIMEINKKSNLFVESKYKRESKKVISVKFIIKKNFENTIDIEALSKEKTNFETTLKLPLPKFEIENKKLYQILIGEFGISRNKAMKILKGKDEFYIKEILDSVRMEIKKGTIKNIPAFTVRAIEEDYRSKKPKADVEREKKQKEKEKKRAKIVMKEQEKKLMEKLRDEFEKQKRDELKKVLDTLSDMKKQQLEDEFKKAIRTGDENLNDFEKTLFKKRGIKGIKYRYNSFIDECLLSDDIRNFNVFTEKKGYSVVKRGDGEYEFKKTA